MARALPLINAGDMREHITLLAPSATEDALGQRVETFIAQASVWAQLQPLRGREYLAAQAAQNQPVVRFRIRWRAGVQATWRVRWRGADYQIQSDPIDVNGARRVLELMCTGAEVSA